MGHADIVTDHPQELQGVGVLPKLQTSLEVHRVDDEVTVYMVGIAVGGDEDFRTGPGTGSKLQGNFVCLPVCDVFRGREGLDILVEVDAVHLAVGGLGSEKFREGILSAAVQPGHIPATGFRVGGFVHPLAVAHDRFHGTDMLLGFFDVGHSRHLLPPMRTSSS